MRIYIFIVALILTSCLARPVVVKKASPEHDAQTMKMETEVLKVARNGDWLVIRGYHAADNLVANATGVPLSHVGIYDSIQKNVVEADGQGIHTTNIRQFIDKSFHILVIRPRWQTDSNASIALEEAKKLIGKGYDFLGLIGFNYPSRYYCSELGISIYKQWYSGKENFPQVIKPCEMYLYGTILYDSHAREEMN